jgi:hypothetical protein
MRWQEDPLARAKRTERADARRRYRVAQAATTGDEAELDEAAPTSTPADKSASATAASSGTTRSAGPAPATRPSFLDAFRLAARPLHIRSDIEYLPTLILHTRAVWVPALAALLSGLYFVISQPVGSNGIANLALQLFVLPPTIAGAFLAGILAPRATYLAGGIAAFVGALVFALVIAVVPANAYTGSNGAAASPSPSAAASASADASASASAGPSASAAETPAPSASGGTGGTGTPVPFDAGATILQSFLISVPFGVAIGAFGGYYRRFLYASSPNRQRREQEQQRAKQKASGRGDMKKRY